MDGEVLGVAVGGGHQHEGELHEQEEGRVLPVRTALQQLQTLLHARATGLLVLLVRPDAECLAEVFLGQSCDPLPLVHPLAVEPLDDQHGLAAEGLHRR